MQEKINKPGSFYLGKRVNPANRELLDQPLLLESKNLTTHAVCVGMTGSGKTGLGIALLEESALNEIPAIIIDPKGDLGNLMLTFPELTGSQFLPWIDAQEAERKGQTSEQYAEATAKTWKEGLSKWGEDGERIRQFKKAVDVALYTPASEAGIPLSILNSFAAPSEALLLDPSAMRDRVLSTTSSLLGLLGLDADPIKSREHILIATILDNAWRQKKDLDLPTMIQQIQEPPFEKVGILATDTFFPEKDRTALSLRLNNLLASPSFQAWMKGEPLNIQNLLYTKEGKPRLAIVTIAHLADSERMFFVTLLLNELLNWMRRQSGTSNLRALLYMDEIFGYFPPSAMPPSKTPMLALLKTARAFGLGIVLATQNPVDLDYKGLANCGTWFIGKLQTERDKARVIEGLNSAANGELNTAALNRLIAACGNRIFLMRSVYEQEPILFQTRWTLSYLRGPLTLPQIATLMAGSVKEIAPSVAKKGGEKPMAPMGIEEYFYPTNVSEPYQPRLLAVAKLHFVDTKKRVDEWTQVAFIAPLSGTSVAWEQGKDINALFSKLEKSPQANASFEELPSSLMQAKNYAQFGKSFAEYLYQNQTYDLFEAVDAKMSSKPGETEKEFRERVALAQKTNLESGVKAIRDRYQSKIKTLQDKIQRAQQRTEVKKSVAWQQKLSAFISFVTALIGSFLGRGVTKGSISQAGTSLRRVTKIGETEQAAESSEESLNALQQQLRDLQDEMEKEVSDHLNSEQITVEKSSIRPRKSDISVTSVALIWCPKNFV